MSGVAKTASYFAATLLLPLCTLMLRWVGLKRTCHAFGVQLIRERKQPADSETKHSNTDALRIYHIVHRVARRLPIRALCVPRSIVVCRILAWFGAPGVIRISVKRTAADLEAHAWVEYNHAPLGESDPITKGLQPFS